MTKVVGKIVMGSWQEGLFNQLIQGNRISTTAMMHGLKGKAARYSMHYSKSIDNLIKKMQNEGFIFTKSLGPCGGAGVRLTHIPINYIELVL